MNSKLYFGLSFSLLLLFISVAIIGLYGTFLYLIWAGILAYATLPLINQLEKRLLSRQVAIISVLTTLVLIFSIILAFFANYLYREIYDFSKALPILIEISTEKIQYYIDKFDLNLDFNADRVVALLKEASTKLSSESIQSIFKLSINVLQQSFSSIAAFFTTIANFYLLPLVYYHLSNQPNLLNNIATVLPASKREIFHQLAFDINNILRQFVRGLIMLSLVRSIIFSIGLHLLNLQYGFIIGLIIGLLSVIPYLGIGVGIFISFVVAFATLTSWLSIILIFGFFSIILIIDNVWLQDKFIERKSSLSPLDVTLAIVICGNLLGTIGVFFVVPLMSIAKYLTTKIVKSYALENR